MGAQWPQMGTDLLRIPTFRKTVERCNEILKSRNIERDLFNIITSEDPELFEDIINSCLGLGVVQIGMCNILKELQINPDFLVAPSFGEIGCGYYDGCLSEEEALLAAYYRGVVCSRGISIKGAIAFIHLGHEKVRPLLLPGIEISGSYNSSACVVGGPVTLLEEFSKVLEAKNIKFQALKNCNVLPFHTTYLAELRPIMISYLDEVIPNPKQRSQKWKSTSVRIEKWGIEGEYCSGEYFANNFCGYVSFEETCKTLPDKCISLEIGPTGQLFKIVEQILPNGVHFALGQRENPKAVELFLNTLKE